MVAARSPCCNVVQTRDEQIELPVEAVIKVLSNAAPPNPPATRLAKQRGIKGGGGGNLQIFSLCLGKVLDSGLGPDNSVIQGPQAKSTTCPSFEVPLKKRHTHKYLEASFLPASRNLGPSKQSIPPCPRSSLHVFVLFVVGPTLALHGGQGDKRPKDPTRLDLPHVGRHLAMAREG